MGDPVFAYSKELFQQFIESVPDAGLLINVEGRISLVNEETTALFGYTRNELIGKSITMVLPERLRKETIAHLKNLTTAEPGSSDTNLTVLGLRKDGVEFPVEMVLSPIETKDGLYVIAAFADISRLKRTEQALVESERRFLRMATQAPVGLFQTDPKGDCVFVNDRWCAIAGMSAEAAAGKGWAASLHPEDRDRVFQEWYDAAKSGKEFASEYRYARPDGSAIWVFGNAVALHDEGGHVLGYLGTVTDITARKQAEEALRESEYRHRMLSTSMDEGYCVIEVIFDHQNHPVDYRFLEINPVFEKQTGITNAVGRLMREIAPAHEQHWFDIYGRIALTGESQRFESPAAALNRWYDVFAYRVGSPELRRVGILFNDITARKEAENALRHSEERFKSLVLNIPGAVYRCAADDDWTMEFISDAIEEMSGYPASDFLDNRVRSFASIIHPQDTMMAQLTVEAGLSSRNPYLVEYRIIRADGDLRWVSEKGRGVFDKDGTVLWRDGAILDITERKQTEERLRTQEEQTRQSQKMEAIGRLSGGIGHDFNNMLMTITGYSELMLSQLSPEDPNRKQVEEIKKAGQRGALLINQLLAFSRKQVLQLKELDLNAAVLDMERMLKPMLGEQIQVVTALTSDPAWVKADRGQIEQVLVNLALHARESMTGQGPSQPEQDGSGGTITIKTAVLEHSQGFFEKIFRSNPGAYVMLTVSDSGPGMDSYTQEHCFEPFFSPKGEGTGLELPTVYGIVKQSGGHIEVASKPGEGTIFTIYLPRIEPPIPVDSGTTGTETILLAEDELMVRGVVHGMLEMLGYTVLEASDGNEAMRIGEEYKGAIHLLLTDVVMPGMNGQALAEKFAVVRPETRVLYMSGYTDDVIMQQGILRAGTAFLAKPFTPEGLSRKLRQVLEAPFHPLA